MPDALLVAGGALIIVAIGVDIAITLLHPAARGPLSYAVNRSAWGAVAGLSRGPRSLSYAGPVAMLANMLMWVFGLWLGHALVYASAMDFGDALYTSGEAISTVGFGNVTFDPEWLRYVAVLQAAGGFGVFTAAIAYVLSVYPLVTQIRAAALFADAVADSGDGGDASVLTRRLIESHEHVKRFPVLYYFESGDDSESMATLLKSAVTACLRLRDAGDQRRADGLQRALERLFDDLESEFIGGRAGARGRGRSEGESFVERADQVIAAFAREHRQEYDGLPSVR